VGLAGPDVGKGGTSFFCFSDPGDLSKPVGAIKNTVIYQLGAKDWTLPIGFPTRVGRGLQHALEFSPIAGWCRPRRFYWLPMASPRERWLGAAGRRTTPGGRGGGPSIVKVSTLWVESLRDEVGDAQGRWFSGVRCLRWRMIDAS
jgi:hypothetical protein